MYKYRFTSKASKEFLKLDRKIQMKIIVKLDFYCANEHVINFAEPLTKFEIGQYRFRIGDYRVIFDLDKDALRIVKVGHRKNIYR